jgi:hypothetical protein
MRAAAGALVFTLAALAASQARADACEAQIPRTLADALSRAYPGYRAPLEYDNAPEDIDRHKSRGGTGCLGVDTGDFTGDGKKDYVVGLTSLKGNAGLAVVALPQKGGWRFVRLQRWAEHTRASQYVAALAPGAYRSAGLECSHWAARVGAVEGSATVYCYVHGQWKHERVSD